MSAAWLLVQARPDLTIGYNPNAPKDSYEGPTPDHDAFGVVTSTASGYELSNYGLSAGQAGGYSAIGGYPNSGQTQQDYNSFAQSSGSATSSSSSSSSSSASSLLTQQQQNDASTLPPIITKSFYFESAPEEPEEEQQPRFVNVGRAQKNYKVIFIKAPTYGLNSQIIPIVPQNEDKTIIYVLSKKPEHNQNVELPSTSTTEATKPDVFFIKYKSEQEAREAQQKIQNVYETNSDDGNSDVAHLQTIANSAVPNIVSSNNIGRTAPLSLTGAAPTVNFGFRGSFDETSEGEGVNAEQTVSTAPVATDSNSEQSATGFTVLSGQPQSNDESIFIETTQIGGSNEQQPPRGIFSAVSSSSQPDSAVSVNFISTGTATTAEENLGLEPEYLPPNSEQI